MKIFVERFSRGITGAAKIAGPQKTYKFTISDREANLGMIVWRI
jgi:hypothetical protein